MYDTLSPFTEEQLIDRELASMSIDVKSPQHGLADSVGGSPHVQEISSEDGRNKRSGAHTGLA